MNRALVTCLFLGLTACARQGLSQGEAESLAMDYWRREGITMHDLGLCGGDEEGCLAAIECIETAAGIPPARHRYWASNVFRTFDAFQATTVSVEHVTQNTRGGVSVGESLRERADLMVHVAPHDVNYANCPAFAELAASIEQPVRFEASYEGEQMTRGNDLYVEWRLTSLQRARTP